MKNEVTGAKVATIAGRILESLKDSEPDDCVTAGKHVVHADFGRASGNEVLICTVAELRTALTQTKHRK